MTSLFVVLVLIEQSDLIFALDSIPAILAITDDVFIVFTSNIFAILGLRSMYFMLSSIIDKFIYLRHALAIMLFYIGCNLPSVGSDVLGIQNVKIRESDMFLNGYYDFNTSGSVRPYVKLGVGYMFMKKTSTISNANVDFANMERKFNNLAAAAGIGILYNVSDKFFLDIGYTAKFAFKTNETYSITRSEENTKKLSDIPSIKGECLTKNSFGIISIAVGFRF